MFAARSFTFVLSLVSFACSSDRGDEPAREPRPKDATREQPEPTPAPSDPVVAEPAEALPDHMSNQVVTITPALARAQGLAPLGFSLDFTGTAFTVSPFTDGSYLYASGPPGGPLGIRVSPVARNAEFAGVTSSEGAKLITEQVDLLGAKQAAVAWVSGESMARTSWCAIIIAPPGDGDDALLVEVGVGHQQPDVTCKTALGHSEIAKVLPTLKFL